MKQYKNVYLMIALSMVLVIGYFVETKYISKNISKGYVEDKVICAASHDDELESNKDIVKNNRKIK